jgi:hypothetical protein
VAVGIKLASVDTTGSAMLQNSKLTGVFLMTWLTAVLMTLTAQPLSAQTARIVPINIFGDSNPLNGVEDSREPVTGREGNGGDPHVLFNVLNQQQYLIGIRNGSHWDEQVYPTGRFPLGPPDGSAWDRRLNTNFGRAIDT